MWNKEAMMKFKVIEIRKGKHGQEFVVETKHEAVSEKELRKRLDNATPSVIVDKDYRVKEVE
jgi:hypothetical protein